jgi:hypothetical protein
MKRIKIIIVTLIFSFSVPLKADLFGGDVVVLAKILANAIQQLVQLRQMLSTARNNLETIRDINRGIDDALRIIRTLNPDLDPGIYKDWRQVADAVRKLEQVYGIVVDSPLTPVQRDLDRSAAEAITKNNKIFEYTKKIDQIGEDIKRYSRSVSPKGAVRLTAESMGVALHVMNESLRAQATGLKMQAQTMASKNKQEKDRTREILKTTNSLKSMMNSYEPQFQLPRFDR